jgi:hypothetical protein
MVVTNQDTMLQHTTIIPIFFTRNFGKKRPILDRHKKNPLSHFGQVI